MSDPLGSGVIQEHWEVLWRALISKGRCFRKGITWEVVLRLGKNGRGERFAFETPGVVQNVFIIPQLIQHLFLCRLLHLTTSMITGTPPGQGGGLSAEAIALVVFLGLLSLPIIIQALLIWWLGLRGLWRRERASLMPTPMPATTTGSGCLPVQVPERRTPGDVEQGMVTPESSGTSSTWGSSSGQRVKGLLLLVFVPLDMHPH